MDESLQSRLPSQRFWRETVSLLDAMRLKSNQSDQVVAGWKTFLQKVESTVKFRNKPRGLYFSKALFEGLIFGGGRCLSTEGNLRFKFVWARLIVESKFTVFALVYFVFEGNFPSISPPGAYLEGRFNGGFSALPVWGTYIWRGLFSEFHGSSTSCNTIRYMLRILPAQGKLVWVLCSKWRNFRVPKVRIHATWNNLICSVAKQVWCVGDKTHNIAFQLVLKQCWTFVLLFYRSLGKNYNLAAGSALDEARNLGPRLLSCGSKHETDSSIWLLPVHLPKACWNLETVWHTRGILYHSRPVPSDGEKQGILTSC